MFTQGQGGRMMKEKIDLLIRCMNESKKTVFFVTHDVDEALLLANRICVFGQSPSKIIHECRIPEDIKPTRETIYENGPIMKLRTQLIRYINQDVTEHIA